jgi:hypothetical protein
MPVSLMVLFLSSFLLPADLLLCDKQLFIAAIGRADLGEVKPSLFANRQRWLLAPCRTSVPLCAVGDSTFTRRMAAPLAARRPPRGLGVLAVQLFAGLPSPSHGYGGSARSGPSAFSEIASDRLISGSASA